ncbi:hypothetical protein GIB67_042992 [Kingdonia uniflora]|uniref:Uncharacterized protein n=1 Tax=Kingdonia uniflora TaxID=39325 RepID=A0A7J7NTJ1_9MAGN|nr:hypothetical protein GIB67_042992 [Kingdonia uniflora]
MNHGSSQVISVQIYEKLDGRPLLASSMTDFEHMVNSAGIIELPFSGSRNLDQVCAAVVFQNVQSVQDDIMSFYYQLELGWDESGDTNTGFYHRRTNELKSAIDIPNDVVQQFKHFWSEHKDAPLKGRNAILRGICPQVFGLFTVKLAGVQHVDASGTKIRGESHFLLVGDPGSSCLM